MARPPLLVRPLAALAAGLLVAGLVQAAPAAADEPTVTPALSVAVSAHGLPGGTEDAPADLGPAPGSATLDIRVGNDGPEDVQGLVVTSSTSGANGTVSAPECDLTGLPAVDGVGPTLPAGQSVTCSATVSGVAAGSVHESAVTASGTVGDPASPVSVETPFFATASAPAPVQAAAALTISAPASAVVGSTAAVTGSLTRAGAPYAAPTVLERQLDGSSSWDPVKTVSSGPSGTLSTTVRADRSASYRFRFDGDATTLAGTSASTRIEAVKGSAVLTATAPSWVPAGSGVTVKGSLTRVGKPYSASTVLERQVDGSSAWTSVATLSSSTAGALSATVKADRSAGYRYRFAGDASTVAVTSPSVHVEARKQAVALTVSAPTKATTGTTFTVKGTIRRDGKLVKVSTQLQRQVDGSSTWSTIKNVSSSAKGALSTTVKADRSASYRYRYAGTSTVAAGTSRAVRVTVKKADVKLTVSAPGSVTKGKSIKVKGTVRREGKKYRTTTVLEFRAGGGWSRVKTVRSSSKGGLSASVKPSRSGEYRYRFAGNTTTASATSRGDHVTVKPKPPARPKPKAYANCTALNRVYPHGVGRSGAKDKVRGSTDPVTDFVRDTATYKKNTKSDRDRDGIACEKP